MRRLILLVVLAALALPAEAAKRVTVAQLEQALTAAAAAHKADAETARLIDAMELSERLTGTTLERLSAHLLPGSQAALTLLADQSAFLHPPANELPSTAAPDEATQQRMLEAARRYGAETLPRLPNFLATRTINRYDDSPKALSKGAWPVRAGLHLVNTSSREISVRDERENQPPTQGSAVWRAEIGLISGGEFGTTLGMILTDSEQGKITWGHWEQMGTVLAAVFQYAVPKGASHFEVIGSRERADMVGFGSVTRGSRLSQRGIQPGDLSNTIMVRTRPGYHGAIWLERATGTILRITVEADAKDGAPFQRAGILVQYGPVQIGGSKFICPLRSLALSVAVPDPQIATEEKPTEWLNVTQFSGYHRFASTTRILADTPETQLGKPESASELPQVASPNPDETASTIEKTTPAQSGLPPSSSSDNSSTESIPTAPAPTEPASAVPAPPMAEPAESTPAVPAAQRANEPQPAGNTIELNVNRLLVPVVVRDTQGRAVGDLKKEDFQVFDNDKPRAVSAFTIEKRGATETNTETDPVGGTQPSPPASAVPPSSALPERILVFLFDDMHLNYEDLAYARPAAAKVFAGALANTDLAAVVSTSGKVNSGLTRDPAKLQEAMSTLQPRGIYRSDASECPKIDYYQADLIENKHDNGALQDAINQVMAVCNPRTPPDVAERLAQAAAQRVLNLGSQDVRTTYAMIGEFVRRMAKMPGQRTLILVSSGFLPIEQEARTAESRLLDLAAQSNVIIGALNARGVYSAAVTASDDTRGRSPDLVADYRRTAMSLAENAMGELADGTGGIFFHGSNDLDAGFKSLTEAPEVVYVLELSLDTVKPDGTYHRLKVKVGRPGLRLQARRGYVVPKPEKNKR